MQRKSNYRYQSSHFLLALSRGNEVPQDNHKSHHCNNPTRKYQYESARRKRVFFTLTVAVGSWFHTFERWHRSWTARQHFRLDQTLISSQRRLWVTKQEEFVRHGSSRWDTSVLKAGRRRIQQQLRLLEKARAIRWAAVFVGVSPNWRWKLAVYRNSHPIASNAYKTSASLSPSYEKSS